MLYSIIPQLCLLALLLTGSSLFAALCRCLALTTRLRAFVMRAAARLRKNTILLNFTVKSFECLLKRITGIDFYLTHEHHQCDLPKIACVCIRPLPSKKMLYSVHRV